MTLTIILNIIRSDPVKKSGNVFFADISSKLRVGGLRMEVEVDAKKGIPARQRQFFLTSLRRGIRRQIGSLFLLSFAS